IRSRFQPLIQNRYVPETNERVRQTWHFSRDFTESSCAVTPSTSPSSSPALSSAKGLWIMVFISFGKAKTLGIARGVTVVDRESSFLHFVELSGT
ncbi:hypothetical protein HID58_082077, partial [Brassica napus]